MRKSKRGIGFYFLELNHNSERSYTFQTITKLLNVINLKWLKNLGLGSGIQAIFLLM